MREIGVSTRRGAAFERDWTKGNIFHNLLSLSWPMIVSSSLNMLGPTVDMIWVGKLGAAAIAGVGVAGMVVMLVNSMMMGLFTSLRAMVARFVGTGDEKSAIHAARQAIVLLTFIFKSLHLMSTSLSSLGDPVRHMHNDNIMIGCYGDIKQALMWSNVWLVRKIRGEH